MTGDRMALSPAGQAPTYNARAPVGHAEPTLESAARFSRERALLPNGSTAILSSP